MATDTKRVLVVDDSVFARKIICDILDSSPELSIAGTAIDGMDALKKIEQLKPDVVTLDVEMPKLDGLGTLAKIMSTHPIPVVMLSSLTLSGAKESMTALSLGAVDVMAKPHGTHSIGLTGQAAELIAKVVAAAGVNVKRLNPVAVAPPQHKAPLGGLVKPNYPVVLIGSSTGGPRALRMLLPALGDGAGAAYVVVQHIPQGFSAILAHDLNELCEMHIREAQPDDTLRPGEVLFAKAGYHLVVGKDKVLRMSLSPLVCGVRPSADVTMASAAPVFRERIVGVVLTGMGRDGSAGLRAIKEHGGATLAEHESSCVIYGMPRVAIESGVVDVIKPIERMADAIRSAVQHSGRRHARQA